MKILFIAPANSIHTYRWIKYFSDQGIETFLVSTETKEFDFSFLDFYFIETPYKNFKFNMLKGMFELYKIIRKVRPDIIHVHYVRRLGWVPAIFNFHPLVLTPWGSDLFHKDAFANRLSGFLTKLSFRKSDLVTSDSYSLIELAKNFGAKNTDLITFGVEEEKFYKIEDKTELKRKYDIPENSFIIISPRAMNELYNVDTIIMAFAKLALLYDDMFLLILEYNTNPDYKDKIYGLVGSLNLENKVKFIQSVKHEKLNEIYNLSDVMVSIPTTDGTPATFFEAMLSRLLILSIKLPAYDGIVKEGQDILFISSIEPEELKNKIAEIYENKANLETVLDNALITGGKNNFRVQMQKVLKHYNDLLNKV
jgi:glycosyltransferase involved in cell wall biosynthesis